jgi:hypothetical protein
MGASRQIRDMRRPGEQRQISLNKDVVEQVKYKYYKEAFKELLMPG